MKEHALLNKLGIINVNQVYENLSDARLVELAIQRGEGVLATNGALSVQTGKYTGRSPLDRFIVNTEGVNENIAWGKTNQPMCEDSFWRLFYRLTAYMEEKDLFIFNGFCGADEKYRLPITVINQYAWQNLFVKQLFIRPTETELNAHLSEYTIICVPGFNALTKVDGTHSEAFVILNLKEKIVIIGGTHYAGEMKKSLFTVMNYLLPDQNVLPMHCSANINAENDTTLFFGLSGTGKTTLSADPDCRLIGDDEHGWSEKGVFNFEGGCYAKCINLSREKEPQIWDAIRFGAVLENVALSEDTRILNFDSDEITENTRVAYPIDYIPNAVMPGIGGHPKTIIFLTADAFGVMPPIAKLTPEQAMYHFLSGYTSKLAGTERGITEPQATFSTGFGEPFLPRHPMVYANLLKEKINAHGTEVFLVNTGWSGGSYGVGKRMNLSYTRAMVKAAMTGDLSSVNNISFVLDPIFGFQVPTSCPDVPSEILIPRATWSNPAEYDNAARSLADRFIQNFEKFETISAEVIAAGPTSFDPKANSDKQ